MFGRIKRTPADDEFSRLVRERDGWRCLRCNRSYLENKGGLTCSHFWGRAKKATRFDPKNCIALCVGCHSLWEGNKQGEYRTLMLKRLGKKGYSVLEKKAEAYFKYGKFEEAEVRRILLGGLSAIEKSRYGS